MSLQDWSWEALAKLAAPDTLLQIVQHVAGLLGWDDLASSSVFGLSFSKIQEQASSDRCVSLPSMAHIMMNNAHLSWTLLRAPHS